jgi:hypothetical protein
VTKRIPVDELYSPFDDTYHTCKETKDGIGNPTCGTPLAGCLRPNNTAYLLQELNKGDYEASKTYRAEAVGECSLGSTTSGLFGKGVRREVPRSIDTSDNSVDSVL